MDNEEQYLLNTAEDNKPTVEQTSMLNIFRKERDDTIQQKFKMEISLNHIQATIKDLEEETQRYSEWKSKLDLENRQLKEADESEIHAKRNLENDIKNMNRMSEMFHEQLIQLENTFQAIEVNTENIGESKAAIVKDITKYLNDKKLKQQFYEREIKNMQTLINTEIENDEKVIQERSVFVDNQNNELSMLTEAEQELTTEFEESQTLNSQLEAELQKKRADKDNLHNEIQKLQDKYSEIENKHNMNKMSYETQIETLNTNITTYKESIENIQNNKGPLEERMKIINEEMSQVQSDLNNLETNHCEMEENLTNLLSKLEEIKTTASKDNEERNSEILYLEEKLNNLAESGEQLQNINKKFQKKLEDKKKIKNNLKEELLLKTQQEVVIKTIEETRSKNKENSSDYEKTINEYKNNIDAVKLKNIQKIEAIEFRKIEVIDKQDIISNIRNNIKNITDKKNNMIHEKISTVKKLKEEFSVAEKDLQSLKSEIQKVNKSIEKEIKSAEKNKRDKINKIEKEIKQFKENMDTTMKNDNDKHIKERRALEDSIKAMNLQMNEFNTYKQKIQEENEKTNKEILDVKRKTIEAKNNETILKKSQNSVFKSPNLLSKSASKPKTCLKKAVKKPEKLTQKQEQEIQNLPEKFDDSFPLTQKTNTAKTAQKSEIKKVEFLDSSQIKLPSLTVNSGKIRDEIPVSQKNWPEAKIWPTDNETTDDDFNKLKKNIASKNNVGEERFTSSLSQNKRPYDFLDSENTENETPENNKKIKAPLTQSNKKISKSFWASEDDSDDSFFGKLKKSEKIQSTQKEISNPTTTINLNTSSSS